MIDGKSGSQIIRTSAVSHRRVIFYTFTPDVVKSAFFFFFQIFIFSRFEIFWFVSRAPRP